MLRTPIPVVELGLIFTLTHLTVTCLTCLTVSCVVLAFLALAAYFESTTLCVSHVLPPTPLALTAAFTCTAASKSCTWHHVTFNSGHCIQFYGFSVLHYFA